MHFLKLYFYLIEYTQWNVPTSVEEPAYLDFDIEAQFLENDDLMEDQLEQISNALAKHLKGNGTYNNITATLLPICLGKYLLFYYL